VNLPYTQQPIKFRGRKITVAECKFVYDKVWNATCSNEKVEGHVDDHIHHEGREEIMLTDLFHIIHYTGILLNKSSPDDSST